MKKINNLYDSDIWDAMEKRLERQVIAIITGIVTVVILFIIFVYWLILR